MLFFCVLNSIWKFPHIFYGAFLKLPKFHINLFHCYRMAQTEIWSLPHGWLWSKWTVWVWLLSSPNLTWYTQYWMPNVEALRKLSWRDCPILHRRCASVTESRYGTQFWTVHSTDCIHGQSSPQSRSHIQKLWKIRCRMLSYGIVTP